MSEKDLKAKTQGPIIQAAPSTSPQNKDPASTTILKSPKKYHKPAYLNTMSEAEKQANLKVIENMNKRLNYLKNPRFKTDKAPPLLSTVFFQYRKYKETFGEMTSKKNPFSVTPIVVQFQDCKENMVYELPLKLTNKSGVSRRIKWVPPKTYFSFFYFISEYFAIGSVKHPSADTGLIAPGMSLSLTVRYAAPGLGDLDDEIVVITEEESFKVPVIARRTPPDLRMESPIVAAPCWLGVRSEKVVKCTNLGGIFLYQFIKLHR